jgi:hypothetical protein
MQTAPGSAEAPAAANDPRDRAQTLTPRAKPDPSARKRGGLYCSDDQKILAAHNCGCISLRLQLDRALVRLIKALPLLAQQGCRKPFSSSQGKIMRDPCVAPYALLKI